MKNEEWSSSAIPPSAELRSTMHLHVNSRKYTRDALARGAFATRLNDRMQQVRVHAGLRLRDRRLEPILEPYCLKDLLYVTLLHHVGAGGDTVARRCDGCHGIFFVSATNQRRAYCGPRCKNTAKVRRWRQRQREAATSTPEP